MLYPIGIQDFEKIRTGGYVYVDKTELVYKIAEKGGYYFLSRPRRFGKSLLVSTLEAYFSGKKELFDGLAIADLEKDWIRYPVLRFDLTGKNYSSEESLIDAIGNQLESLERLYKVAVTSQAIDTRFKNVIDAAYAQTNRPVVILIDVYDKPIVDNLGNDELYFQNTMYVMLKIIGQQVQVERHTSNVLIDVLIQTDKYVYIMELRRDKNPDDALDQIDEKGYDWSFLADDRKVFKIGTNFSTKNHRLENWKVAE